MIVCYDKKLVVCIPDDTRRNPVIVIESMWTETFENRGYRVWFRILVDISETTGSVLVLLPQGGHFGDAILIPAMAGASITRIAF